MTHAASRYVRSRREASSKRGRGLSSAGFGAEAGWCSLSLHSGGERSLAAVALLIAIFKARPSPFYILDEVEAALDDANLGRLLTTLEDLRESSQLIVITHQKRTMEIADALYGVSMRQDGVSAVVGQRVREEREAKAS